MAATAVSPVTIKFVPVSGMKLTSGVKFTPGANVTTLEPGTIKPKKITALLKPDPDVIGGKAASLVKLVKAGYVVPIAWVIPCEYSINRPDKVSFSGITTFSEQYAVRSGAPVSMPGLLNTRLNVSKDDLMDAVLAVWDSWNTDHAKAYRKQKGLSDSIGTAVIIQEMVPDVMYAGVAFTADPDKPEEAWEYNPVVEYVEGLGDKLVGGEAQPTRVDMAQSKIGKTLDPILSRIHDEFGASDVEWVITKYWDVFLVQQRPVKFSQSAQYAETIGNAFVTGRPIGAPVVLTATATTDYEHAANKVLYITDFKPEYYQAMIEAAAIACKHGGATCHASIISREMNKPAVSGIDYSDLHKWIGKEITIDGRTGALYDPASVKIEATATIKQIEAVRDESRVPNLGFTKLSNTAINANHLLARFYWTLEQQRLKQLSAEVVDKRIKEIANILNTYFFIAVCCEARHANRCCVTSTRRDGLVTELNSLGLLIPKHSDEYSSERSAFAKNKIPQPDTLEYTLDIVQRVDRLYNECKWTSSYGGKAWGRISTLLLKYLEGRFTDKLFVDAAFNMRHNGGLAFDKFSWLTCDNGALQEQLNIKASKPISALLKYTKGLHYGTEAENAWTRDVYLTQQVPTVTASSKPDTIVGVATKKDPSPNQIAKTKATIKFTTKPVDSNTTTTSGAADKPPRPAQSTADTTAVTTPGAVKSKREDKE